MTLGISVIAPLIIKIDWSRIASYFAIITSRKVFIARALKFKMAVSRLATFMTGRKTFQRISRGNREVLKESAVSVLSCRGEPELRIFSSCGQTGFFLYRKNNQLSKYRVIFSWYSSRGLFVLYLVQLDNKFGEHEKSVKVTRDAAESNCYFSSAPRTSHGQMH